MNERSSPAADASCSCENPFCCRDSRKTAPNAHFGPLVGWTCARFLPRLRLPK
jgi:hypothetical protein